MLKVQDPLFCCSLPWPLVFDGGNAKIMGSYPGTVVFAGAALGTVAL